MTRRLPFLALLVLLACGDSQGASDAQQKTPEQGKAGSGGQGGSGAQGGDAGAGAGQGGSSAGSAGSDTAGSGGSDAGSGGSQAGSGGSDAGSGGSTPGGSGGQGGSSAGSSGQGGSGATTGAPKLATSVEVTGLAVFQAVKVTLVEGGQEVSPKNAPVVAGREALVRAYAKTSAPGQSFTAELLVENEGKVTVVQDTRTLAGASSDDDPASVFVFSVEGAQVQPSTRLSVRVLDGTQPAVAPGEVSQARYPRDGGTLPLSAGLPGGALKITLVPMRYDADGSGRLPDTSPGQLETMRALLRAIYPVDEVVLTVREPVPWSASLSLTGNVKFGTMNNLLVDLREQDKAPGDVYYYALVAPAKSFSAYCGGSCVTGQSFVVSDPGDADIRVGSGLGFSGEDSAWTLAHELGHMHGRSHAPCGVTSSDAKFPYSKGATGVWGHDERSHTFFPPDTTRDLMGYCEPTWISDYTYRALFLRVQAVNGAGQQIAHPAVDLLRIHEEDDGSLAWGAPLRRSLPHGPGVPARWLDASGRSLGAVRVFPLALAHGGATWLAPPPPPGARSLRWEGGRTLRLP